jgi:Fungal Zn(2)-Cys(6) binuclear cluster domain
VLNYSLVSCSPVASSSAVRAPVFLQDLTFFNTKFNEEQLYAHIMNTDSVQAQAPLQNVQNVGASHHGSRRHESRQATHACQRCRKRKVKCDLLRSGPPCHSCNLVGTDCIVSEPTRNKGRPSSIHLHGSTSPQGLAHATPSRSAEGAETEPERLLRDTTNEPSSSVMDARDAFLTIPTSHQKNRPFVPPFRSQDGARSCNLPSYIRPSQRRFKEHELECLTRGGALSIPERELRDALLYAFSLYSYPFLPVLDMQDLLEALEEKPDKQVSLMLFQGVMFAGSAFVDLELLLKAGFADRMSARAHFYEKIKVGATFISLNHHLMTSATLRF